MRNRFYDSKIGRFTTEDPVQDGVNWYVYCGNNPVMWRDGSGLAPTPQQAAAMAEHIYNYDMSYSQEKRTVEGWRLITVWEGREGLKMGFYIPSGDDWQNTSEYSIVFKGTTWYDLGGLEK